MDIQRAVQKMDLIQGAFGKSKMLALLDFLLASLFLPPSLTLLSTEVCLWDSSLCLVFILFGYNLTQICPFTSLPLERQAACNQSFFVLMEPQISSNPTWIFWLGKLMPWEVHWLFRVSHLTEAQLGRKFFPPAFQFGALPLLCASWST